MSFRAEVDNHLCDLYSSKGFQEKAQASGNEAPWERGRENTRKRRLLRMYSFLTPVPPERTLRQECLVPIQLREISGSSEEPNLALCFS